MYAETCGDPGKGIPGRSEGPKVGLCLAGIRNCQEASVAGLGEPWAEVLRNGSPTTGEAHSSSSWRGLTCCSESSPLWLFNRNWERWRGRWGLE